MKDNLMDLKSDVESCKKCGEAYGNSAIGFGKTNKPLVFFVGINPWVKNHKFSDGRGITRLKEFLYDEKKFGDFFFDNIVKCQMPKIDGYSPKPDEQHAENCWEYLERQIKLIQPKTVLCFGNLPSGIFRTKPGFPGVRIYHYQHFSSIFYPNGMGEKIYYAGFSKLLDTIIKNNEEFEKRISKKKGDTWKNIPKQKK